MDLQTERQNERRTDRQTDREMALFKYDLTNIERVRWTERQIDRQRMTQLTGVGLTISLCPSPIFTIKAEN